MGMVCFQFLDIVNKAPVNTLKSFYRHMFSFLLGKYFGVELLGYRVGLYITFKETAKLSSKMAEPFYIPTSSIVRVPVSPYPCNCLSFRL